MNDKPTVVARFNIAAQQAVAADGALVHPEHAAAEPRTLGRPIRAVGRLQIFRVEASMLGQSREHPRPDFFVVVKCEHDIGPPLAGKRPVRT